MQQKKVNCRDETSGVKWISDFALSARSKLKYENGLALIRGGICETSSIESSDSRE